MLTIGAFNALLKTLEEPPSHVIFILATTDPHKVPITILSRCQRFDLKKISEENIIDRLKYICNEEKISIEENAISEIAHLGDGCLRDSLSILDQVISYKCENITVDDVHEVNGTISQENLTELIKNVINKDITAVIKLINDYNNKGKSIIKITEEIIQYYRNLILSNTAPDIVKNNIKIYEGVKNKISIEQAIEYIQNLNQTLLDMKKFSNTKMLLELAFISIINSNINEKTVEIESLKSDIAQVIKKDDFPGNKIEKNEAVDKTIENLIENDKQMNENVLSKLNKFIDTRVSNTLYSFSKKNTNEFKSKLNSLNDYIMDETYGNIASMILDGELKAVGNDYIIFAYNTINLANMFNQNIPLVEKLLISILDKEYKVIAVDSYRWNEIKENFNSKKKVYEYITETEKIENILNELNSNDNDNIQSLFGDLVEYK